jgi:hypothetical protein
VPHTNKNIQARGVQRSAQKRADHFVFGWMSKSVCVAVPDHFQFLRIFTVNTSTIIRNDVLRLHRNQSCMLVTVHGVGILRYHFRKHLRRRSIPTQPNLALKASDAKNALIKVDMGR